MILMNAEGGAAQRPCNSATERSGAHVKATPAPAAISSSAISREMQSLIEQAPGDIGADDIDADDTARLYESVSDLQRQIDELNKRSAP